MVVFHTLHRGKRDTRLCPLIIYRLLRSTLTFSPPRHSSFTSLRNSSPLSPSVNAAAATRTLARLIPTCYHHQIHDHAPGALSDLFHRSNSDHLAMYCVTVFCPHLIYSSIVNNTASYLATATKVYLHLLSGVFRSSHTISHITTWV